MRKILSLFILLLALQNILYADHYYDHYDDRYGRQNSSQYQQEYQNPYTRYEESYPQGRAYPRHYTAPNYNDPSEVYYSCPRGDYISDRPGQCPLDGSVLVRRSSYSSKVIHYSNLQIST